VPLEKAATIRSPVSVYRPSLRGLLNGGSDRVGSAGATAHSSFFPGLRPSSRNKNLEKVCAKLRVRTRIEAVAIAVRSGWIDPEEGEGAGGGTSV